MMSNQDLLLLILKNTATTYGVLNSEIEQLYREVQLELNKIVQSNRGDWAPEMPDVPMFLKELKDKGYLQETKGKIGNDQYDFATILTKYGIDAAYSKEPELKDLVGEDGFDKIICFIREKTEYKDRKLTLKTQ